MKLSMTKTIEVNANDYTIERKKYGQAYCDGCPFFSQDAKEILEHHHKECYKLFEQIFGDGCCKIKVTKC